MASTPGILTDWPWKPLGSFKYVILGPWVAHSLYCVMWDEEGGDPFYNLMFPFLLVRMVHYQIWISLSRYRTAVGANRIVDRGLEFDQVDRETNWDDGILLTALVLYSIYSIFPEASSHLPFWRTDGVIITAGLHAGAVEFLYYWLHRALHHHFLYTRYHSHHHSSILTQPITSVIHPFIEVVAYLVLFIIPVSTTLFTRTASIASLFGYIFYIDFMNNLGHCNFEFFPRYLFSFFPFFKYLCYTPSFHSLHHTKFRTNYSLFMPLYDYIYGTMDESSDETYETCLKRPKESPHVVHLTHLTTLDSLYHLPIGITSLASNPQDSSKWYLWLLWPFTICFTLMASIFGHPFVSERTTFRNLNLQTWVVPRFTKQYLLKRQNETVNKLIEEAILEADSAGAKVLSLGLLNQKEELNACGQVYMEKFGELKIKIVDGSSLAAAIVLNAIPKDTNQVLLRGSFDKVSCAIANALCERNVQKWGFGLIINSYEFIIFLLLFFKSFLPDETFLQIWLVGNGWDEDEQMKAAKGSLFIPFSQFPPKKMRKDCFYHNTPAMMAPSSFINMHSCEVRASSLIRNQNWLPRRAMSACRIAGIVHGLEGWNVNECGFTTFNINKVWDATIRHGFQPLNNPIS
ncbi:very-long-chain aldehyde decarbonylase CER1-like [Senna tora]|uniref:Very-long-chain aldehyde decarbonylase CER1-like n=1 Tax=Senna tora TaxID=362788 RepID=A0A834WIH0_9FABA|nr:very-long-chain aldehyde decarbonylase CER1-like [Senna tora]